MAKNQELKKLFPTHFMRPFYPGPKLDKNIQKIIFIMNRHEKCLKISVSVFQHHTKDGIMEKWDFCWECKTGLIEHYINQM